MKKVLVLIICFVTLLGVSCTTFRASVEGLEKGEIEIKKEQIK